MGTWGTGLWESDTAMDLRDDYKEALKYSTSDENALEIFLDEHKEMLADSDDGPIAWLILAQSMHKSGRLTDFVLEKARQAVSDDLENWKDSGEKEYNKRRKELDKFMTQLTSPQPEPKPVKRIPPFVCTWKRGDAFLWKDKGTVLFDRGTPDMKGFAKFGIVMIFDSAVEVWGKQYMKFYLKFSENTNVSFEDIPSLPYMFRQKWIETKDGDLHIEKKSWAKLIVSGEGYFAPSYSCALKIKGTDFTKKMKYLGNIPDIVFPEGEQESLYASPDFWRILEHFFPYFLEQTYGINDARYSDWAINKYPIVDHLEMRK